MNENDILGFDPTQLSVFADNSEVKNTGNVYRMRPEDSKSKDGVYRATIKFVYNPFNFSQSIIEQQGYYIEDEKGGLYVVSALTNNDVNCPIFKAWKKCRYSDIGSVLWKQQAKKEEGGKQLFDKRFARYVTIQVLEDKNNPDLEGKYMFWKVPKSIFDLFKTKQNPSKESGKCPIPVMDFLFGRSFEIEVKPGDGPKGSVEYRRNTSYIGEISEDVVSCTNPDGTPLLTAPEQAVLDRYVSSMKEVWKEKDPERRNQMLASINADPNTAELQKIYKNVIEKIKTFCPNIFDELSYHGWDEDTTKRVNDWITVILSGDEPKKANTNVPNQEALDSVSATGAPNPFDPSNFSNANPAPAAPSFDTAPFASSAADDDLPF